MDRDIYIQYCGPYSIQTSDAVRVARPIESVSIEVERGQLKGMEQPVIREITPLGKR